MTEFVEYSKISVLDKLSDLIFEEDDEERIEWLLDFQDAVENEEADDGAVRDLMNGEHIGTIFDIRKWVKWW